MTPEFAQIHTCILRDPNINGLSPESGWNWVRLIVLAKTNKDHGRVGTVVEAAYVLHVTVESIRQTIHDLDGRIVERDDQLYIRDWSDWQTLTNKERQATFKEAHRNGSEQPVTDGNGGKRPVTGGNGQNDKGKGREGNVREQLPSGTSVPPDRWTDLLTAISGAYGGKATRRKSTGALLAWAANITRVAGKHANNDPPRAVVLWNEWFDSLDEAFIPSPDSAADKFGAWCAKRGAAHARPQSGGFNLCPDYDEFAP